jgi:type I restriction enzyme S subunit
MLTYKLTQKIGSGSTPRGGKNVYIDRGIPFLRSQNIWNHGLSIDDVAYIPKEIHKKMAATVVQSMDVLVNITGASIGRCAIVPDNFKEANVSQHVTIIRCINTNIRQFLHIVLLSPHGQSMIWSRQVGMSREGLSKKVLEKFQIPLPPLPEQKRIVAKVDKLMKLCDQLEQNIDNSTHQQTQLLNAIVAKI